MNERRGFSVASFVFGFVAAIALVGVGKLVMDALEKASHPSSVVRLSIRNESDLDISYLAIGPLGPPALTSVPRGQTAKLPVWSGEAYSMMDPAADLFVYEFAPSGKMLTSHAMKYGARPLELTSRRVGGAGSTSPPAWEDPWPPRPGVK